MSAIWAIIKLLNNLWDAFNRIMDQIETARKARNTKKRIDLERALEDSKKATTDEEIWDAQERIVDNSKP